MAAIKVSEQVLVVVVGIGCDGWNGLAEDARLALSRAPEIWASDRQAKLLPHSLHGRVHIWPSPMSHALGELIARLRDTGDDGEQTPMAVLASGDPMFYGIGERICASLPENRVMVIPALSSVTLARARLGWSASDTKVISVCGRNIERLLNAIAETSAVSRESGNPNSRVLVLCAEPNTPGAVCAYLHSINLDSQIASVYLLANLGGPEEKVEKTNFAQLEDREYCVADLYILALQLTTTSDDLMKPHAAQKGDKDDCDRASSRAAGRPSHTFANDGQITRPELRAMALAHLAPVSGEVLWDIGAGSGAVGAEWLLMCPEASVVAVERNLHRVGLINQNRTNLQLPGLQVIAGDALSLIHQLPMPDAIFIGGATSNTELIEHCIASLSENKHGRLVAHGVTLEAETALVSARHRHGGDIVRVSLSHCVQIGAYSAMRPAMTVTQWLWRQSGPIDSGEAA